MTDADRMEDSMIRAAIKTGLTKEELFDIFMNGGLMGVYNLGMKHMYEYLKEKDNEKAV